MLLRNSISNTKKFFQKTLESFKSLLYPGIGGLRTGIGGGDQGGSYQRLPKTPPLNPFSCGQRSRRGSVDMENMLQPESEDDQQIKKEEEKTVELDIKKKKKKKKKETEKSIPTLNFDKENMVISAIEKTADVRETDENGRRHVRLCWLAQRLKELEMIIDKSNVDHMQLDIEEVLLYYSRLTYPTYMDIVDKFFMDLYAEFFFGPQQQQNQVTGSSSRGRGKLPASLFV